MLVFNQQCLLMLVLSTWIRSERNQVIWNAFYSFSALLSTITTPRLLKQKIRFRQKLRPVTVNFRARKGAPVLPGGSLEVCRKSQTQGEAFIISYFQPLWPNPTLVSSEIHFCFYLFISLNNWTALGDIFKPYIVINYPQIWNTEEDTSPLWYPHQ